MKKQKKHYPLVRFDWAMKKLLRQKANFDILEGFLSELLKEKVRITRVLESESNKEAETDKYNRVDIFVENEKGELLIIEIQNTQEYDYFHRILYGVSKTITEHISQGDSYAKVKNLHHHRLFPAGRWQRLSLSWDNQLYWCSQKRPPRTLAQTKTTVWCKHTR